MQLDLQKNGSAIVTETDPYVTSRLLSVAQAQGDPIQREIAGIGPATGGNIAHANAEVGIREIAGGPGTTPGIGGTAKNIGDFGRGQRGGLFSRRPAPAAVPGQLDTDQGRVGWAIRECLSLCDQSKSVV